MRDSLDLKNKTIKRIQGVQRHKYWATSIARWTTSSCNTCRHTLDTLCCPEADGPTNLEQPTLNHVHSDTMASAVSADPTRALQGTNRGAGRPWKSRKMTWAVLSNSCCMRTSIILLENCPWETI
ncbi:hypothetical protein TNCV_3095671 [Trichonephila clavipes]|nr:hypothetical protein TNCV_3095671 [Trichonephila clavipes]